MISHIGKVNLEAFKEVDVIRKEMVDGKEVKKQDKITIRFDFSIPMGSPYELVKEVLGDLIKEVDIMDEQNKKRIEEEKKRLEKETKDVGDEAIEN